MKLDELMDVDVDLNIAPQCEHSEHYTRSHHGGVTKYYIEAKGCCLSDGETRRLLLCENAWEHAGRVGLKCVVCREMSDRESVWRIISVL